MVLLYRPDDDQIIWRTQQHLMHQHDVDIVDSTSISVFNNRRRVDALGDRVIDHNEVLLFDFDQDRMTRPFATALAALDVRTLTQGLAHIWADGRMLIEETEAGRLVLLSSTGDPVWEFLNKDQRGETWTLNWSRVVPDSIGEVLATRFPKGPSQHD